MAAVEKGATVVFVPGFMQPGDAWAAVASGCPNAIRASSSTTASTPSRGAWRRSPRPRRRARCCAATRWAGGWRCTPRCASPIATRASWWSAPRRASTRPPRAPRERRPTQKLAAWMETQDPSRSWPSGSASRCSPTSPTRSSRPSGRAGSRRTRAAWRCCCAPPARARWSPCGSGWTASACRCWRSRARSTPAIPSSRDGSPARCRDGRAAIVEGAGHAPQLQRPAAVAELLGDFLDQHFGQSGV